MWYFTWILGVLLALSFGVINVMWYEAEQCFEHEEKFNAKSDEQAIEKKQVNFLLRFLKKMY